MNKLKEYLVVDTIGNIVKVSPLAYDNNHKLAIGVTSLGGIYSALNIASIIGGSSFIVAVDTDVMNEKELDDLINTIKASVL